MKLQIFVLCCLLGMSQFVYSGQSDNSGKGKHKTDKVKMYKEKKNKNAKNRKSGQSGSFFSNKDIDIVLRYYSGKFSEGHCPPGLAKKNNGCLPPGQAKKWRVNYPLPDDVVYYDLPRALLEELARAPEGHKYVRIAADILLITIGTSIVIDAIEDLVDIL